MRLLPYVTKLFIFHATQWPVNKSPPSTSQSSFTMGLMLNSDHAQSILDTGPQADSVEVSGFCLCVCLFVCLFVCWITSLPLVILILHVMEVVDQWRKINYFVVASYLPISRVGVCEPAFSRFLFFLSRELTFNKTVEQHQPDLLLIEIIPMRMLFPAFFFFSFILFLGEVFPCVLGREVRFAAIPGRFDSRGCCVAL